ncbi:MAG: hypothetical protein VX733_05315 [Candidatus Latescibacterota bacterium]|nr:hypothetical protein [Candidatus Latescibacterota bacterium]
MAWVFISVAVGALVFVVFIVLDYLRVSAGFRPRADLAKAEIVECESKIDSELGGAEEAKEQVAAFKKEVAGLKKELGKLNAEAEEIRAREKRLKPTRFKVKEEEE